MLKTGARMQSQVCETQIIVVKSSGSLDDLRAGGVAMVPLGVECAGDALLDPAWVNGNTMGKRYVEPGGGEVLVTKSGAGTLAVGQTPMTLKEAKPLPASD